LLDRLQHGAGELRGEVLPPAAKSTINYANEHGDALTVEDPATAEPPRVTVLGEIVAVKIPTPGSGETVSVLEIL
jgi:hypothetical protein